MKLSSRERKEVTVPSSSLADIAFLLIIFFMVASLVNTAKGMRFDLPAKKSQAKKMTRDQVVIVELNKQGKVLVDGSPTHRDALMKKLALLKRGAPLKALLFQVKRNCAYSEFAATVSMLRHAGYAHFSIKGVD